MKKRRDLNALVNGRGRKHSSVKKGQHELLRNHSDSSEVEEFSVPPSAVIRNRQSRFCSVCLSATTFLLVVACLASCGGLIWMQLRLRTQLQELRGHVRTVESGGQNPEEYQSLHTQVKDLVDSVNTIKTGKNGLQELSKSLASVIEQVDALKTSTQNLQQSVAQAPHLQTLPAQIAETSKEVANLGSQVEAFKSSQKKQEDSFHDLQQKVAALQGQLGGGRESHNAAELTPGSSNELTAAVSKLNATCSRDIHSLEKGLETIGQRVHLLENRTTELGLHVQLMSNKPVSKANSTQPDWQHLINNAVKSAMEHLQNSTLEKENQTNMKDESVGIDSDEFDEILQQVQNVSTLVTSFKEQIDELKQERGSNATKETRVNGINVTKAMSDILTGALGVFKEQYNMDILRVNISLDRINSSVTDLQHGMLDLSNATIYLKGRLDALPVVTLSPSLAAEPGASVTPGTTVTTTLSSESSSSAASPDETSEAPHVEGESHDEGADHSDTYKFFVKPLQKPVKIPGYETKETLQDGFSKWDIDGDGKVSYEDIQDHLGPALPAKELFKPYDENSDGFYSIEELGKAEGIAETQDSAPSKQGDKRKREQLSKEDLKELAKALEGH